MPHPPTVKDIITSPYSVNISWEVPNITYDAETSYSVQYGTYAAMLVYSSKVVDGNPNRLAVSDVFSVNIDGLTPFTTYYYIIWSNTSINNIKTCLMSFRTNETGMTLNENFKKLSRD